MPRAFHLASVLLLPPCTSRLNASSSPGKALPEHCVPTAPLLPQKGKLEGPAPSLICVYSLSAEAWVLKGFSSPLTRFYFLTLILSAISVGTQWDTLGWRGYILA